MLFGQTGTILIRHECLLKSSGRERQAEKNSPAGARCTSPRRPRSRASRKERAESCSKPVPHGRTFQRQNGPGDDSRVYRKAARAKEKELSAVSLLNHRTRGMLRCGRRLAASGRVFRDLLIAGLGLHCRDTLKRRMKRTASKRARAAARPLSLSRRTRPFGESVIRGKPGVNRASVYCRLDGAGAAAGGGRERLHRFLGCPRRRVRRQRDGVDRADPRLEQDRVGFLSVRGRRAGSGSLVSPG